ncbi:MAG: hypothetical protein V4565_10820 [Bacteroidota bacterium]
MKKLLLGDSVGNQLFPNTTANDTVNSLCCNQAIGIIGHFFLLNNYLEAGNDVDTVFMLFTPSSFLNNLNQIYTYHYFLKPFYKNEYKPLFTATVNEQIKKIPYSAFCQVPTILTSNWAPNFKSKDKIDYTFISPVSAEYLKKIKLLSIRHNFKLIILSPPVSFRKKMKFDKINKNEIAKNNFDDEFKDYFKTIIYLNDSLFMDGTHLKKEELVYYRAFYKKTYIK